MYALSFIYPRHLSSLQAVFAALTLTMSGIAAAAEDGNSGSATTVSSEPAQSSDFQFHLDALSLNVYGLAYHPDRETVHREHLDNEFNPGLALHYELDSTSRGVTFAELGAYRDSGRNWAKFASLGYQFKMGESWRIGGALAAFNSKTYNRGVTFLAMVPLVTYDLGHVQINAVYFPKIGNYNEVAAFGFYLTVPMGQWMR
jgi:hypothetical protein